MSIWAKNAHGISVFLGDYFPEPSKDELAPYRATPGHGTKAAIAAHEADGEPLCMPCAAKATWARRKGGQRS